MSQIRVMTHGHMPLVTVLWTVMVTLVPQQRSEAAVGGSNNQPVPHWTVLLLGHVTTGARVSCTVTRRLQWLVWFRQSTASQVSVMSHGHRPLVVAPTSLGVRTTLQQLSQTNGGPQAE